jgi:hypothetical protein
MRLNFFFALASYGSPWRSRKRGGKEQHPRGGDVLLNIRDLQFRLVDCFELTSH